jgi:hypothetical protein
MPQKTTIKMKNKSGTKAQTKINLNWGNMVVKVEKLKKKSNFNLDSPTGTAGIRG